MHATLKEARRQTPAVKSFRLFSGVYSFLKRHSLCIITVIVPTLLSTIYFGFIASDIYTSQSIFAVQSPQMQIGAGGAASLLVSTGLTKSSESSADAYTVQDYILSRDALAELNQQLDLRSAWSSKQIDFLHRFGMLHFMNSFEWLFLYYKNRIDVEVDSDSNLVTLSVTAFSADEAHQIDQSLLQASEHLVNTLNDRMQKDLIGYAMEGVDSAKQEVEKTSLAVSDYRNGKAIVDPVQQANLNFELISSLQNNLIVTKTELANLRTFAPNSPVPPTLELKIKTLQTAIDTEMAKAAGNPDSLSSKDARYEQLELEEQLAGQQLAAAQAALLEARDNAQQQQLYLEVVAQPSLPDSAMDPKRAEGVLVTLVVGLIAWGISTMLITGIRGTSIIKVLHELRPDSFHQGLERAALGPALLASIL